MTRQDVPSLRIAEQRTEPAGQSCAAGARLRRPGGIRCSGWRNCQLAPGTTTSTPSPGRAGRRIRCAWNPPPRDGRLRIEGSRWADAVAAIAVLIGGARGGWPWAPDRPGSRYWCPAGHQYDRVLTAKMTAVCVLVACLFPGGGYDTALAGAVGLPGEQAMKRIFEIDAAAGSPRMCAPRPPTGPAPRSAATTTARTPWQTRSGGTLSEATPRRRGPEALSSRRKAPGDAFRARPGDRPPGLDGQLGEPHQLAGGREPAGHRLAP